MTFTLAMTSSSFTALRLYSSEMMPLICGLMLTSSRGTIFPVMMVVS